MCRPEGDCNVLRAVVREKRERAESGGTERETEGRFSYFRCFS
jgi:hypothetical protein